MTRMFAASALVLALAAPGFAQTPLTIAPISFGDALLEKSEEYGERELERLADDLDDALRDELAGVLGQGGYTLQATIIDARPNRPTQEQMFARPGLDMRSISIGGAEVTAIIVDASGQQIASYEYAWRTHSLRDVVGASVWYDANRTFRRFADQIADDIDAPSS
ncbi:hypothetical protein RMQ97_04820 [Maricaulis sp. D1M11]|uniref:hypothetical protein n=1 Tax=Maricaulis sp. D1M11 TaxID=3076117 RepID=UPI0039B36CC3